MLPHKVIIQMEGETNSFPDKQGIKEVITTKQTIQKMLKELL